MVHSNGSVSETGNPERSHAPKDSKLPLELLLRLQMWVGGQFETLATAINNDSENEQYLRIMKRSPHPLLVTSQSLWVVCRVSSERDRVLCSVIAYNNIVVREVTVEDIEDDSELADLKTLLLNMNSRNPSLCSGIKEEKLMTWVNRKNLSSCLIERNYTSKVVFRSRICSYVMPETASAHICRACAMLLSTASMPDQDTEEPIQCPVRECSRVFKYQGALDKHIAKQHDDDLDDDSDAHMKIEPEESLNHIKLEPEVKVSVAAAVSQNGNQQQEHYNEFIDRLLSEIDVPTKIRKKRKKKLKPSLKDFHCSDCGKAFYYQKNLFSHVVEKHGKSPDELPNLDSFNEDEDVKNTKGRKRLKGETSTHVTCDECGVSFKFASGLYNHRKRMHGDIEKKQCPHCPKEVKSCTLEQHIREEHGTPRFFLFFIN